jgi:RHS repeat-associated protein
LKTEQDPSSKYAFLYDADGHLAVSDNSGTPSAPHLVLTYSFDGFGNRTGWQDNYGGLLTLGYNADNDLTSENLTVSGTQGPQVTLAYDAQQRLTGETRFVTSGGSKITEALNYDNADRLTTITYSSSQVGALATFAYGYDNASQLTSYTGPEGSLTYSYDNASELTGVGGARNESFGYDLNGNRNTTGYTTAAGNELTSDGTYTYSYDSEGNQVSKTRLSDNEQWTFTWDYRNRMTQAVEKTSAGVTVTADVFTYDVEDRRIGKSTNGAQVWYGYSDVVAPTGSGEAQSNSYIDFNGSGSVTMRYLQRLGLDSMLGRFDGTNVGWYLTDNIGSIRLIVNPSGTILDQIAYYAYGGIQNETNSGNGDRFKFSGAELDAEIGLQHQGARYYNPLTGRWDSRDPIGFKGGDFDLYRYVYNTPVSGADPTGLDSKLPISNQLILIRIYLAAQKNGVPATWVTRIVGAANEAQVLPGYNKCVRWVGTFEELATPTGSSGGPATGAGSGVVVCEQVGWTYWGAFGHAGFKIQFRDGQTFYIDDQHWGQKHEGHFFLPRDVPEGYTEGGH